MRYRLQAKKPYTHYRYKGDFNSGEPVPVETYRWVDTYVSNNFEALKTLMKKDGNHRIEDTETATFHLGSNV